MTLITLHEAEIRFREEAETVAAWINAHSEVPRLRPKGYRRVNFPIFQHYVAYIIRGGVIWIVAIAHAHRRPEFWLERLDR